ncbi:MAG: hypothetical protein J0I00_16075 [Burkholderiales bacterium]|nr:hypothetical protein [Burkholderiales bacterium]
MKQQALRDKLDAMAQLPGINGCALVEVDAGMVWHHAGQIDGVQALAEAASDYWRLYGRLAVQFKNLGELRVSIMVHAQGRLTLLPCGAGMLLVALTGDHKSAIDWTQWNAQTRELAQLVKQL